MTPDPAGGMLSIALKEWAVVCRALEAGRQIVLLRKGGILESLSGFDVEHRRFLLFPTYLHQNPEMLKADERAGIEPRADEPQQVALRSLADVVDVVQLRERPQIDAIDDEHIWSPALLDMRFNYKPQNPLYLLVVRALTLPQPVTIENAPAYAGCKSWVPLRETVDTAGARPAMDDASFDARRARILEAVRG